MGNFIDKLKLFVQTDKEFRLALYDIMGFYPHNIELYRIAFAHKSQEYKSRKSGDRPLNNERLEFLGDAVLETVVSDIVYHRFQKQREGFLTNTRSKIVSRESLGRLAKEIGIDRLVQVHNFSRAHNSFIGGNAFEALVGAIYLDRGFAYAFRFIEKRIIGQCLNLESVAQKEVNFKSKLLEYCQKNRLKISFIDKQEPDAPNAPAFLTKVVIEGLFTADGKGYSKKEAQQNASREALLRMRREPEFEDSIYRSKEKRTAMEADPCFSLPVIDEIEADIAREADSEQQAVAEAAKKGRKQQRKTKAEAAETPADNAKKGGKKAEKTVKASKAEKADNNKADNNDKPEKPEKTEKAEKAEKPEKTEKPEKAEKPTRKKAAEKAAKVQEPEVSEKAVSEKAVRKSRKKPEETESEALPEPAPTVKERAMAKTEKVAAMAEKAKALKKKVEERAAHIVAAADALPDNAAAQTVVGQGKTEQEAQRAATTGQPAESMKAMEDTVEPVLEETMVPDPVLSEPLMPDSEMVEPEDSADDIAETEAVADSAATTTDPAAMVDAAAEAGPESAAAQPAEAEMPVVEETPVLIQATVVEQPAASTTVDAVEESEGSPFETVAEEKAEESGELLAEIPSEPTMESLPEAGVAASEEDVALDAGAIETADDIVSETLAENVASSDLIPISMMALDTDGTELRPKYAGTPEYSPKAAASDYEADYEAEPETTMAEPMAAEEDVVEEEIMDQENFLTPLQSADHATESSVFAKAKAITALVSGGNTENTEPTMADTGYKRTRGKRTNAAGYTNTEPVLAELSHRAAKAAKKVEEARQEKARKKAHRDLKDATRNIDFMPEENDILGAVLTPVAEDTAAEKADYRKARRPRRRPYDKGYRTLRQDGGQAPESAEE